MKSDLSAQTLLIDLDIKPAPDRHIGFGSGDIEATTAKSLFEHMAARCAKLTPGTVLTCHVLPATDPLVAGTNFCVEWTLPDDPLPSWVKWDVERALAFLEEIS